MRLALPPLLLAVLVASPAVRAAGPSLLVTDGAGEARVFVGPPGADGAPECDTSVVRSSRGTWTAPAALPRSARGLPLAHRGLTWFLDRRTDAGGARYYLLAPLSGERVTDGVRIEAASDAVSHALGRIDDWTFALAELADTGEVLVRVVESKGPSLEMEVVSERGWPAGWPPGTRLLAVGITGASAAVIVGLAPDARVVASAHDGVAASALPGLEAPEGLVAACVTATGPFVVRGVASRLLASAWTGTSWTDLPPLDAGPVGAALAAAALGRGRETALVVLADAEPSRALVAAAATADGWGPLERVALRAPAPATTEPAPDRSQVAAAERRQARLRMVRWALVVAGGVAVAVLLSRLVPRARRG